MKKYYYPEYIKGATEKLIKELVHNFITNKHDSQITFDSLDLVQIFGYIDHLELLVSRFENITNTDYMIRKLQNTNYWLDHDKKVYEERLKKADEYVTYLGLKCKYHLNSGHLRKLRKILRGKDNG